MLDISTRVAVDAARLFWQGASAILPQAGVWLAANTTGDLVSWALGKKSVSAEHKVVEAENKVEAAHNKLDAAQHNAAKKSGFFSRLNPLPYIRRTSFLAPLNKLNPISLASFAISPLLSVSRAASWFLYQGFGLANVLKRPMQAFSPIAEKFLAPILEKAIKPILNYLQNNHYLEIPKPTVVCPEVVCPEVVCPSLQEALYEAAPTVAQQAANLQETGNMASRAWSFMQINLFKLGETASASAPTIPMQRVFEEVVQDIPAQAAEEVCTAAQEVFQAAEPVTQIVTQRIPQTYFELTEHYAEPAGRFVAETMSSAYHGVVKIVQKPADIVNATNKSIDVMADGIGIPREYFIGAALGVAACYGLYSWHHARATAAQAKAEATAQAEAKARSEAAADAKAAAQGGTAHANGGQNLMTVNVIMPNGQAPALANHGATSIPALAATAGDAAKFKAQ
ncbi:MAG: hypothetical protein AB7I18_03540 [Candidatus Berkiella sp.]